MMKFTFIILILSIAASNVAADLEKTQIEFPTEVIDQMDKLFNYTSPHSKELDEIEEILNLLCSGVTCSELVDPMLFIAKIGIQMCEDLSTFQSFKSIYDNRTKQYNKIINKYMDIIQAIQYVNTKFISDFKDYVVIVNIKFNSIQTMIEKERVNIQLIVHRINAEEDEIKSDEALFFLETLALNILIPGFSLIEEVIIGADVLYNINAEDLLNKYDDMLIILNNMLIEYSEIMKEKDYFNEEFNTLLNLQR